MATTVQLDAEKATEPPQNQNLIHPPYSHVSAPDQVAKSSISTNHVKTINYINNSSKDQAEQINGNGDTHETLEKKYTLTTRPAQIFSRVADKSELTTSLNRKRNRQPTDYYDYYDDDNEALVNGQPKGQLKVVLHGRGVIECLDQGNFPHPLSCYKFISCAKFETGDVVGWEYTCPTGLSFDPVGGMCNWSGGCNQAN